MSMMAVSGRDRKRTANTLIFRELRDLRNCTDMEIVVPLSLGNWFGVQYSCLRFDMSAVSHGIPLFSFRMALGSASRHLGISA